MNSQYQGGEQIYSRSDAGRGIVYASSGYAHEHVKGVVARSNHVETESNNREYWSGF